MILFYGAEKEKLFKEKIPPARKKARGKNPFGEAQDCKAEMRNMQNPFERSEARRGQIRTAQAQRKPSAPFGGMLCSECRTIVAEETAKTIAGKKIFEVDLRYRPFVEITLKRL